MEEVTNKAKTTARLESASVDLDRHRRCGFPEVVFAQGKTAEQLREILSTLVANGEDAFATRVDAVQAEALTRAFAASRYNPAARTFRVPKPASNGRPASGSVAVISAGSSDLPVAEEVRETLDWMGVGVTMIHDVGVAGPHRLRERLAEFEHADAVVVVAGMEGGAAQRGGRLRRLPRDWRPHERRLRCEFRRPLRAAYRCSIAAPRTWRS